MSLASKIKEYGKRIGLDIIRIAPADPFLEYSKTIKKRINEGLLPKEMEDAEDIFKRAETYSDPSNSLHGAKSIVSIAMCYFTGEQADLTTMGNPCGVIARAYWKDYYEAIHEKSDQLAKFLIGKGVKVAKKSMVPKKLVAVRAGVGWQGKNSIVQTERHGSWIILGALITDAKLEPDEPLPKDCGDCQACIRACPTSAIQEPHIININRCIDYLTVKSGIISRELRSAIGNRICSCDRCQEVCPNNRNVAPVKKDAGDSRAKYGRSPSLISLSNVSEEEFKKSFLNMDWHEPKLTSLQRNVAIALGNLRDPAAVPTLINFLRNTEKTMRLHAAWALGKIRGKKSEKALKQAFEKETDGDVREEIADALANFSSFELVKRSRVREYAGKRLHKF